MNVGYLPHLKLTIEDDDITRLRLESYTKFKHLLEEYNVSLDDYARNRGYTEAIPSTTSSLDIDNKRELSKKRGIDLYELYIKFTSDFKEKTHISIHINFHDSKENGRKNDDLNGYFFSLCFEDIYKQSDTAIELCKKVFINTDVRFISQNSPVSVIEVTEVDFKKLSLNSFDIFSNKLDEYGLDLDEFIKDYLGIENIYIEDTVLFNSKNNDKDEDEVIKEVKDELSKLFVELCEEFRKKTNLSLYASYHDSSRDGDCYDDIDGCYFYLDFSEFYEETESAKRLKEIAPFRMSKFLSYD